MIHIKNRAEIQKMRDACRLAAEVLNETGARVAAGVNTLELNDFAEKLTRSRGATSAPLNYRGFPKSICTSINDVVCHGIPKKEDVLKEGDIINIDITVILDGFHGDTSRMFVVGEIPPATRRLIEDTERSMYTGIDAIQPNGRISDIGEAIDNFLTPKGYGIVRDLAGHGIGRVFHEEPSVPHYRQKTVRDRLRPGMTFTVEPMVNQGTYEVDFDQKDGWTVRTRDGALSAQFEHTCLVTDNGHEILTRV
jgi:methionyl aminopeptidase